MSRFLKEKSAMEARTSLRFKIRSIDQNFRSSKFNYFSIFHLNFLFLHQIETKICAKKQKIFFEIWQNSKFVDKTKKTSQNVSHYFPFSIFVENRSFKRNLKRKFGRSLKSDGKIFQIFITFNTIRLRILPPPVRFLFLLRRAKRVFFRRRAHESFSSILNTRKFFINFKY